MQQLVGPSGSSCRAFSSPSTSARPQHRASLARCRQQCSSSSGSWGASTSCDQSSQRADGAATSTSSSAEERPGWRQALCSTLLAAAVVLAPQPAVALDANTVQAAVSEYVELDSQGRFKQTGGKALDDFRNKYRMRRAADGRLQLRTGKGEWFQCRLDMEVPGSMLLRDSKGYIYAIQTDSIQQIDLSDDLVALMMFADGEWEKQMSPVEYQDDKGATLQLKLEEREFREVIGLLKEVQELEEEQQAPPKK